MKRIGLILILTTVTVWQVPGEVFRYRAYEGQQYRVLSEVNQEVLLDDQLVNSSFQLNKIQVAVEALDDRGANFSLEYQNSVQSNHAQGVYEYDRSYSAEFYRDVLGYMEVPEEYYVPTVQDVPVFPQRDVQPGETWSAPGREVHDLRSGFNLDRPFRFTMPVSYRYQGKAALDGVEYDLILIDYRIYYPTGLPRIPSTNPQLVTGSSSQELYWDNRMGMPVFYREDYELTLVLADGSRATFRGDAQARVIQSTPLDRAEARRSIEDQARELGLEDVGVRDVEDGISIVMENIQFSADSARLAETEALKLEKIARILQSFPDRDILVTGHTALAGTEAGRLELSQARARAVGQFLLDLGARKQDQMMYQGLGAADPLGDNRTEEGRRMNRRVEITILEN
ncbi:OmpA family protein [Spirochaeta lutea]|uniref:OmpA-like domain-containing protein n=1 Tax=Spirochaeta lutea TaxID=1480694 RepID=A0A098R0Y3_9SPIO|nr:OmpA family protein [Spirochaeta lutea]KGE73426.1 hypothetical protein DC28_03950 [Spirochaeta lutea]